MGVLTIMKLGTFLAASFTLIMVLVWIFVYCPTITSPKQIVAEVEHSPGRHMDIEDYFDKYESQLDAELKGLEKKKPLIFEPKIKKPTHSISSSDEVVLPLESFSDEVFDSIVTQLHTPQIDGFEKLISANNVTIYRKPKGGGLYEYKLYADIANAPPELIMEVFLNNEYRLEWDAYITDLYFIKKNEKGPSALYFNVDYPWPLANRDYVYGRETRTVEKDGKTLYLLVMHSALKHNVPEKKGVIRVSNYHQMMAVEGTPWGGTFAYIYYYDDPKGSIPSWMVNWAAKTGVPGFLNDMQRACNGYKKFLEKHGN